jgi:type IV secretory pathway VirB2 component (pilin)
MAQQLTQQPSLWVERLARFGYAAKGTVYGIVGLLAAQAAFGTGGKTTDTQGALQTIVRQPFGKILLGLVAIGLIGYVLWRFVQAIKDPENKGTDAKGLTQRLGYAISGSIYAGLAFSAVRLVLGSGGGGNSNSTEDWTARLLAQPFGQWLVGTVGAFIIGLGFYQFYLAYSAKFRKELNLTQLSNTEQKWVVGIGRLGLAARGIVFCVIGFFLIQAARQSDPSQARGLGEALQALAQQPYGPWILGIVAVGLVAYGIYMVIQARYRSLVTP